jgi:hypothetical protein
MSLHIFQAEMEVEKVADNIQTTYITDSLYTTCSEACSNGTMAVLTKPNDMISCLGRDAPQNHHSSHHQT